MNNDKANESISKTDSKAQSMGKTFLSGVKTAATWGAAIVGAATTVTTAFIGVAKNTATTCDTIDKASQRVGITAENYQKLAYAADLSGVSTSNLETAAKKLSSSQPGAALDETLIKLAGIADESKRAEEAQKLFGKSAYNLTPLLNAGADGIKSMMTECEDLGLVISNDDVAAGAQFNDTMTKLRNTSASLGNMLGVQIFPIVNSIGNLILDNMPKIQSLIGELSPILTDMLNGMLPPLISLVSSLLPPIMALLSSIIPVISDVAQAIMPVIVDLVNMLLPPLVQIVQMILPLLVSLIEPLLPLIQPIIQLLQPVIDLLMEIITPLAELLNMILPPLVAILSVIIAQILPELKAILTIVSSVISSVFAAAIDSIKQRITTLKDIFNGVINFVKNVFTGNWRGAWQSVVKIFSSIWSGLKGAVKTPINAVIGIINGFIRGLNKLKIPEWIPGVGGKGINISTIPLLANGGKIIKAGRAIVGEAGAELIDLPAGARVTPLTDGKGSLLTSDEAVRILTLILSELKEMGSSMYDTILEALINGTKIEWNNRELARLVKKYA